MTARKTRVLKTGITAEDAFGTPAAARSSMMNVAGASDDDQGLPIIADDDVVEGVFRMRMHELRRLIRRAF